MNVHHSIEKSDLAILRKIAYESQILNFERHRLEGTNSPSDIAHAAQKVSTQATIVETLREVALATGCAQRNGDLIVEAFAGDDSNLWD